MSFFSIKHSPLSFITTLLATLLLIPISAHAQLDLSVVANFAATEGLALGESARLGTTIINVANFILFLLAMVAIIVILYASVRYVISLGDESKTASAKKMIIYAIAGIVVAGLSRATLAAVRFIVGI